MISVLCPTRGRPESMRRSAASLLDLADNPAGVEVLTACDTDDPRLAEYDPPTLVMEPLGYRGLHVYVNELAKVARGRWLFLWNDDAEMLTQGWDTVVESQPLGVLSPRSNHGGHPDSVKHCVFPIVPAAWVAACGHFALNCHNDTWWGEIGHALGVLRGIPVEMIHRRHDLTGEHDDATYEAQSYDPAYYGAEMVRARRDDREVVAACIASAG